MNSSKHNIAGRVWSAGLGLVLILMGGIFVWYLWAAYQRAAVTDSWIETPCVVTSSKIDDSQLTQHYSTKFRLDLEYSYVFEGKDFTGTKIRRLPVESASLKKIERKRLLYPEGTTVSCFVNPENPADVVLEHDSKASLYSIWFPGLFIFGGIGMIIGAFARGRARR